MENNFEPISKVSGFMKHNGGLLFRDLSETEFEFKSTIQKIHLNRRDITHGGFICSLIDAGAGTAVYRASNNQSCVTVSLDVKFIAPSRLGDEINGKVTIGRMAASAKSWTQLTPKKVNLPKVQLKSIKKAVAKNELLIQSFLGVFIDVFPICGGG